MSLAARPPNRFSLFVPHGAPTFALNPGVAGLAMTRIAQQFHEPRAIVIVSAHWATRAPTIGTGTQLGTIHDFQGFDRALYALRYPATGCPEAAHEVAHALRADGFETDYDERRGLDHGAWIPLRQMFPFADVPVVPLSVQPQLGPAHAFRIGRALAPLIERGFFVIGSGNVTHNLSDWGAVVMAGAATPAYVQRFSDWVAEQLTAGDVDALLNYRRETPDGTRAHPTEEHFLPLFTAWGAAPARARGRMFHRGVIDHVISMDGYAFH